MPIEAKAYGPDSTPEEVKALRDLVSLHQEGVILLQEPPVVSEFQADVCYGRIEELLRAHPRSALIIDLRQTGRPSAEVREVLRRWFVRLGDRLRSVAVFTGKNFLLNIAAKFVLAGVPQPFSVHKTLEEAEEAVRNVAR